MVMQLVIMIHVYWVVIGLSCRIIVLYVICRIRKVASVFIVYWLLT